MKSLKTPLRYPGGKSRAVQKLFQFLPKDITEFREPFLGGGSFAIAMTKQYPDLPIWVNDCYEPLFNFWVQLQKNGEELSSALIDVKKEYNDQDKARVIFNEYRDSINFLHTSTFSSNNSRFTDSFTTNGETDLSNTFFTLSSTTPTLSTSKLPLSSAALIL